MMGSGEILVILVVILILFGGKKLPEFAQSLGKGIREFKKACQGEEEGEVISSGEEKQDPQPLTPPRDHDSSQNRS
jgi:sec-independent protein translocase protein TatA